MAMTMAAPNLSQTTNSGTQSDFQTSQATTPSTNGIVVKAEVGCMTMSMPNGTSLINCIGKDGNSVISNNFELANNNCTGVVGGGETLNGTSIGISTMSSGINTSPIPILPSNLVSTGTSTVGLERKPGMLINGNASPPLHGTVGVGTSNFSCSAVVSNCQQIQTGNPSLISSGIVSTFRLLVVLDSVLKFLYESRTSLAICACVHVLVWIIKDIEFIHALLYRTDY